LKTDRRKKELDAKKGIKQFPARSGLQRIFK